jgi:polysaccharide biosynthesis transport protein
MTPSPNASGPGSLNPLSEAPQGTVPVNGALVPRHAALLPVDDRQALAPLPPALSEAPNAWSLLRALRHRLFGALTLGLLLAAAGGTAGWFLMPKPKISARTHLHVSMSQSFFVQKVDDNRIGTEAYLRGQGSFLKSRFVLKEAMREPGITDLPLLKDLDRQDLDHYQYLEDKLQVEPASPELLRISLPGDDNRGEDLIALVNAVTKAFMKEVVQKEGQKRKKQLEDLTEKLVPIMARAESKRKDLKDFVKGGGLADVENYTIQHRMVLQDLVPLQNELRTVQKNLRTMGVELGLIKEKNGDEWQRLVAALNALPALRLPVNPVLVALVHENPSAFHLSIPFEPDAKSVEDYIDTDPVVRAQKDVINREDAALEMYRQRTPSREAFERTSKGHQAAKRDAEQALETRRKQLIPAAMEVLRKKGQLESQSHRSRLLEKYYTLKELEKMLLPDVATFRKEAMQLRTAVVSVPPLQLEIGQLDKVIAKMRDRIMAMDIEKDAPSRISWLDKEAALYKPDARTPKLIAASAAAGVALVLVLFGFAWMEFRCRKIHSPEEVVHGLGMRLVGTVPDLSQRNWLNWRRTSDAYSAYTQHLLTESVDAARTLVLHTARTEPLQIVMITSALSGEGKTSLSSHLAASLARAGRRTVLVDSDLRNPTLHHLFEMERSPGLSELLRGQMDLPSVVRSTTIDNLWIISAGQSDGAALQALAQDGVRPIFQQLRQQYDFIVVDSCPVLPVADSLLVAQQVDAVIFSLLREVSRLPKVHAAYQRLALLGIRMLGAVVNGTRDDLYAGQYHYTSSNE